MPPSLSEEWATAYVQILLTIIIFAIGIPALAMEIIAQEEVRHVAHNRMRITGMAITILAVSLLAFYSFVWWLHPPFPKTKIIPGGGEAVNASAALAEGGRPAPDAPAGAQTPAPGPAQDENEESSMTSLAASIIVTVVPILAIVFGLIQVSAFRRKQLVRELEDELCEGISTHRSRLKRLANRLLWKKRQPHMLREESLQDLIYLGEHGKPGSDKKLVLDALGRVAKKVQESPQYKDGELEALIKGLKAVVLNHTRPGEDGDFILVAKVLKEIRERFAARPVASKQNDALSALKAFEELCVEAVKHRAEATIKELLKGATAKDIDMVFEVGLAALRAKQFDIASVALSKLEALAEKPGLGRGEETENLLGLLAQFLAAESASTRRRAAMYLRANLDAFQPSLEECLKVARKQHYLDNNYDTADRLDDWLKRLEDRNWLQKLPEDES